MLFRSLIIDASKGFARQRLGLYSSELKENLVHSVISFGDFCTSSPMIEQGTVTCLPISKTLIELTTISPTYEILSIVPRFNERQISHLPRNDLTRLLRIHRSKNFVAGINSILHRARDEFYSVNGTNGAIEIQPSSPSEDEQMHMPKLTESVHRTILRKVNEQRLGFDFLLDCDMMSLFTSISASLDESFQLHGIQEAYQYFSLLIIGQLVYLLRSCSVGVSHGVSTTVSSTSFKPLETLRVCSTYIYLFLKAYFTSRHRCNYAERISRRSSTNSEIFKRFQGC